MTILPRARFEILVDGTSQSYRDTKLTAMEAAHMLKMCISWDSIRQTVPG
jgi:hypothetical protein